MKRELPLLLSTCLLLAACDPVTLGLVTAGGGVAVNRQMSSTITRTFSQGSEPVQTALLTALDRMSIKVTRQEKRGEVQIIEGSAGKRAVSLEIEPVTRTSTLIQVAVRQDLLTLDGATGREIVAQTELALNQQATATSAVRMAGVHSGNTSPSDGDSATGKTYYYGYDHPAAATVAKAAKPRTHATPAGSSNTGAQNGGVGSTSAGAGSNAANRSSEPGEARQTAQVQRPAADRLAAAAAP